MADDSIPENKFCNVDEDCADIRVICKNGTCVCSRFYKWDNKTNECALQLGELHQWLAELTESRDHRAELDAEAKTVFYQLGIVGVFAVVFGAVAALGCMFTFCFVHSIRHRKKRNRTRIATPTPDRHSRPLPPPPSSEEGPEKKDIDGEVPLPAQI